MLSRVPTLVIDTRKAFDAGIGTYICQVVPRVIAKLPTSVVALIPARQIQQFRWLAEAGAVLAPVRATPISLAEQIELPHAMASGCCFWATSLAHPLIGRVPVVATVHDVAQLALSRQELGGKPWLRPAAATLLNSLRRRARALLTVSDFTREEFLRCVGQPRVAALTVTPLGVDQDWFAPRGTSGHVPYLMSLGSVRHHKNIERLLLAFAAVAPRIPHQLRVVGHLPKEDGVHLRWLAILPESVRSRILFEGFLDEDALRTCVANADALVFPSLYEGFGLPVLEAMAAGCPVVASRAGALPEVCGEAAAASFDPRDVSDMARAMEATVKLDNASRQRIVEKGREHAARFTWDATAEKTAEVLNAVLSDLQKR
jgi:glycosyltransferase involved in cell wall biosynthesis